MWHVLSNDTVININVPNVKAITTSNLQQQKYLQLKISNLMHIHINQLFSWFWIKPESLRFSDPMQIVHVPISTIILLNKI